MAWKRSSVRSRSGPPNNSFVNRYLTAPASSLLRVLGCGRVRKFLQMNLAHMSLAFLLRLFAAINSISSPKYLPVVQ